jgi:Tol biopolymer transport system component
VTELQADGSWAAPQLIAELNSGASDARPNVRKDGLEIVFDSNRAGSFDIYTATRRSIDEPWDAPSPLGPEVNDNRSDETRATLSRDGTRLYFGSTRANALLGGNGADIYVSTRPAASDRSSR